MLLVLSAAHGYALGRGAFWASLGVDKVGPEEDALFHERLADIIESLATANGPASKSTVSKPPVRRRKKA